VHFSDCKKEEEDQRKRFTKICPEVCELRYLTDQMSGWKWWPRSHLRDTLYARNMAQALMLMMENKEDKPESNEEAVKLAQQTLKMAVQRVTNDNTIRYVRACLTSAAVFVGIGALMLGWLKPSADIQQYIVAGMFGAAGAVFSVVTRLEAFKLRPCDQSNMNYLMSIVRVLIGVMSGMALLLLGDTLLADMAKKLSGSQTGNTSGNLLWETVAVFGFVGGFAERLIPNILRQTIDKMESSAGTPVQAFRQQQSDAKTAKGDSADA
jgi:hypothetical protein